MKVLFVTSEAVPFAKTGGLADVSGTLPKNLKRLAKDLDIRVIMPKYKVVPDKGLDSLGEIKIKIGNRFKKAKIKFKVTDKLPFYFVENNSYFDREGLYGDLDGDYSDNASRFSLFSQAVLRFLELIDWFPEVIHCNDWQTALIPAYLNSLYLKKKKYQKIGVLFTIHNMAYQGVFPKEELPNTNLGWDFFTFDRLEFYGRINFLKSGIVFSDVINTVSSRYAQDIQTPEFGFGLETALRYRKNTLYGILNGIDYQEWDPAKDRFIYYKYDKDSLDKKRENKKRLLEELNLPYYEDIPLLGLVGRFSYQKGFDLLGESMHRIMKLNLYLVILGRGDRIYQDLFTYLGEKYPHKLRVKIDFDDPLGHKIYAGSDIFLMPSRYEPCGLGQMISFKYGTIPIVHRVGGLYDTVEEVNLRNSRGSGFTFEQFTPNHLLKAIKKALKAYQNPQKWEKIVKYVMTLNFSWDRSAKEYLKLYERVYSIKKNT